MCSGVLAHLPVLVEGIHGVSEADRYIKVIQLCILILACCKS